LLNGSTALKIRVNKNPIKEIVTLTDSTYANMRRTNMNAVCTGAPSPLALDEPRNISEIRIDPTKFNIISKSTKNILLCVTVILNILKKINPPITSYSLIYATICTNAITTYQN
jgi:hypothetical protein